MTRTEAIEQLRELARLSKGDAEGPHADADEVLCDLLKALGYGDVVAEYEKVEKWYA